MSEERKRVLVIMNPVSGQGDAEQQRGLIEAHLDAAGASYDIRETQKAGDAFSWASEAEGRDLVIASGGDGTIMEVMSGLVKNKLSIPLAQLPAGTANLLARALDIPIDTLGALELALTGAEVPMDVGYLPDHERYFALVAGVGWGAEMIDDASRALKDRFGFLAYVFTGVKNLFQLKRSFIELDIDGQRHTFRAHTVMIVNVGEIGEGVIKLGEGISPHDGQLNLAIAAPNTSSGLLRLAYRLATRQFHNYRDLHYFQGSKVKLTARPPLKLEIDGEVIGHTPLTAVIVPNGALLVVPPKYAEGKGLSKAFVPKAATPAPAATTPEGHYN